MHHVEDTHNSIGRDMNHLSEKKDNINSIDIYYCPKCMMYWGDEEPRCSVCRSKMEIISFDSLEEVGVEYLCSCKNETIFTSYFIKVGEDDKIKKRIKRFCYTNRKYKYWNINSITKRKQTSGSIDNERI